MVKSNFNFIGSEQFKKIALLELDWQNSHAHWMIEEYSDNVFDRIMSAEEALQEWRSYLNDYAWGTITEAEAIELERGMTDEQMLDYMREECASRNTQNRWNNLVKVA